MSSGSGKAERFLSGLCLAIIAGAFTFAALEAAVSVYLVRWAPDEVFRKFASLDQLKNRMHFHHAPHRYLGHVPTPGFEEGENRHDSRGFRGPEMAIPKPAGVFRIACLGGSTTYGPPGDWRETYPALLEQGLRRQGWPQVEVLNAGVNSYTSWETLIRFELQVLDYEPDMIILYDGINDIAPRLVWPPNFYQGDNSGYMAAASLRFMPSIFEYSTIFRILMIKAGWVMPHLALHSVDEYPASARFMDFLRQVDAGSYPQGVFRQTSAEKMLETNQPRYFERNEENIVAIARARGIRVVFCTFKISDEFPEQPETHRLEYRSAIEEQNEIVRSLAARSGAILIDLAKEFPDDRKFFTDGRHMTPEGERLRAEIIAGHLKRSGVLPESAK